MKTKIVNSIIDTLAIIILLALIIISPSCAFTRNVDGSVSGSVDPTTAAAIVTKIIAEK